MQTRLFNFFIIAAATILFASCTKTNTEGRLVPKDASVVVLIDGKSLSAKLPWAEIKDNPMFKEAYTDSTLPAYIKALMDNPESTGIDTKTGLLLFVQKDSSGGFIGFEGNIKDAALFKTFNLQSTGKDAASEKEGINYINKAPVAVGWNKEKFVYVFDSPEMRQADELSKRMQNDSIDIPARMPRDIDAACKAIFALSENNSLAKNEKFTALMKETGDIRFWINAETFYNSSAMPSALTMLNLEKLYKGSLTTGTLNFDNGKITMAIKSFAGDELTNLYKKYGAGKINEDMLKRMPGKDIIGAMAINFKPQGLLELIKLLGVDGFVSIGAKEFGFTLDDFIKANKGDIAMGISDLKIDADSTASKYLLNNDEDIFAPAIPKPQFNFIFSVSIGDKDAFNKLENAGKKIGGRFMDTAHSPFQYNSNGTYFAISNTKENADKYLAGTNSNFDFISKINGQSFGGYLNIQSLMKSLESEASKDSADRIAYDASVKMWDNILWKGGDMNGDAMTQSIEINLLDKSTNSLKQLNQYAAKLSLLYQQKKQREKEANMTFEDFNARPPKEIK